MSDATHLLRDTAMNLLSDEKGIEEDANCKLQKGTWADPQFLDDGSNMVCSDPPIWLFDGLITEPLLDHVDASFEGVGWQSMNGRNVRMVKIDIDEELMELTQTLRDISHIHDVGPCSKAWIMDVHGRPQGPHIDGWELERNRDQFLDLSRCAVQRHNGFDTIIPSLSFVIYFNESGGIAFPKADLKNPIIPAKRGRIVMFSNYNDAHRPAHNPKAVHYGVYGEVPKRVMTAGVMSNETPRQLTSFGDTGTTKTKGFLYAPIMHRSNSACGDRTPTPPKREPPKPKPVLELFARRAESGGFIVEATNLSGETVSKALIRVDSTLGWLKSSMNLEAQLTSGGQLLDGKDERLPCHQLLQGMKELDLDSELVHARAEEASQKAAAEAAEAKRAEEEAQRAAIVAALNAEEEAARRAAKQEKQEAAKLKEASRILAPPYATKRPEVGDVMRLASFSESEAGGSEPGHVVQENILPASAGGTGSAGREVEWDVIDTVFAEKTDSASPSTCPPVPGAVDS